MNVKCKSDDAVRAPSGLLCFLYLYLENMCFIFLADACVVQPLCICYFILHCASVRLIIFSSVRTTLVQRGGLFPSLSISLIYTCQHVSVQRPPCSSTERQTPLHRPQQALIAAADITLMKSHSLKRRSWVAKQAAEPQ